MKRVTDIVAIILDSLVEVLRADVEKDVKKEKIKKRLKGSAFYYPRQIFR